MVDEAFGLDARIDRIDSVEPSLLIPVPVTRWPGVGEPQFQRKNALITAGEHTQ